MWKTDVERESRSHLSHQDLSIHLRNYLRDKYPGVYWVAVVYDDVTGFSKHTVRAVEGSSYHLWRHYGHNIVVGRLINPQTSYSNLDSLFWQAYSPQYDSSGFLDLGSPVLNALRTVDSTWSNLVNLGVRPVMLHVVSSGVSNAAAWQFDRDHLVRTDGAVLIA